jgi:hypothetical protein
LKPAQEDCSQDPISKNTQHKKRVGRGARVVQHLPNKHEALSSTPIQPKKVMVILSREIQLISNHFIDSAMFCGLWPG